MGSVIYPEFSHWKERKKERTPQQKERVMTHLRAELRKIVRRRLEQERQDSGN